MTILFLDFDGVLHPDPCRDPARLFEHAPRLAAALASFTQLAVVLSTAWRTHHPVDELAAHLPPPLRAKVVGATQCFHAIERRPALVPYRRQAECQHWIDSERPGAAWLALDDRAAEFEPYCDRLIVTRSATGLDEAALNRLRFALTQAARRQSLESAAPG
ncbi:MAG: HAD domain-containing protein [Burkholderiaceae bacterium]|nr:HAD domain-containing protein [Burkholderiaceae bacterium]